jgi:hypothetical protein
MMLCMRSTVLFLLAVGIVPLAVHAAQPTAAKPETPAARKADAVRELRWEELIPAGYRPDEIFRKFAKRAGKLKDGDPQAQELQKELMTAWSEAPVVAALHGKLIKLPGYVIPLEGDGKNVKEFLLVPYFGACIHTPPPPSNQIVFVNAAKAGAKTFRMFDTVMITGTLTTTGTATAVAAAGYTIEATKVEAY